MRVARKIVNGIIIALIILVGAYVVMHAGCAIKNIEPKVVLSASMEPTIMTGDLAFIDKTVEYNEIQIDDIITYNRGDITIIHRVIDMSPEGIETKGDNNAHSDGISTTEHNLDGKCVYVIPKLGKLINVLKTTRGIAISIAIIAGLFLLSIFLPDGKKK